MSYSKSLLSVVGARPQFIKATPIVRAIERHNREHPARPIRHMLVHTGQHYDDNMSRVFFDELEIPRPDYNLGVGSGSHGEQTGEMLKRVEKVLLAERPDVVLVYGDTNSTLAGALAAAKLGIPVAHIEAGLRSFNRRMPEEINRVLTDHISDLLFCPTETAVRNLEQEGITRGVYLVGDVMVDALQHHLQLARKRSTILKDLGLENGTHIEPYYLATVHRAENTDCPERLKGIFTALDTLARSGVWVIVPLHPRTRKELARLFGGAGGFHPNLRILPPVSYLDMLMLEQHARIILTDSGGVQKEAYLLRVPCVTLREETEWVETVESGWNTLAGAVPEQILAAIESWRPGLKMSPLPPFWDGRTSERILGLLLDTKRDAIV